MTYFSYVSLQDDDKILVFTIDAATGKLTQTGEAPVSGGPAALAISPDRNFLYVGRRGALDIASFSIDQANGGITQIGSAPLQGEPVALATDRKGGYVLSAYYYQRSVGVHRIENGAAVTPAVEWLMTASGAHSIQTDPSNRFAFVPPGGPTRYTNLNLTKTPATSRPTPLPEWSLPNIWGPAISASIHLWTSFTSPTSKVAASPLTVWIPVQEHCRRSKPSPPCPMATPTATPALRFR